MKTFPIWRPASGHRDHVTHHVTSHVTHWGQWKYASRSWHAVGNHRRQLKLMYRSKILDRGLKHCSGSKFQCRPRPGYWIARPAKPGVQIQLHQSNDCMQQHYDITQFEYILWRHTMHEWVINIHYKIKLESPKGDSQTQSSPPRNNGACVIILKNSTIGFIIFICHTVSS